ncbi:LytR/AlgR family response regulator transcription factor [Cesiribacter andamanensis]|uniref:Putative transcriptional regulatory protein YehT n=1 Tax=Cesiribacter andamanensis AMV16 TaxID=1279009 RepID=M7N468_9BACT|nr:LytTR family DNA-binding domain-containing protein [Cesiribacter andamanensis]EMR03468.1 putative transcriptional regulatory protein YehT [Cesiribacter andamanensis AMV16]
MIKAILVDDDMLCRKALSIQLHRHCPDVNVLTECSSAQEGLTAVERYQPDLVFLDVEMPLMSGFDMLQQLDRITFHIIFTTSFDTYAIRAIKFSALDYLLKPIDTEELKRAVAKIQPKASPLHQHLDNLLQHLYHRPHALQKVALPTLKGYKMISLDTIIRCESEGNYTHVFLKKGERLLVSRQLKEIEELLEGHSFLRVHHSHLINLNEITHYMRGEGGWVVMSDNASVNVSRSRKVALLNALNV